MPESRTVSAISFGVFCRFAPSTRPIMRSRNEWPGSAPMRTTMRSESTLVPPVTAERSPPLSRMTGADSPVTADSSTEAMPSITSPSPGMTWPASTTTTSPLRRSEAGTLVSRPSTQLAGDGLLPQPAQGGRLGLAPALREGLREVREEHREPEPEGHLRGEPGGHRPRGGRHQVAQPDEGGQHAAHLDHEHHGVLDHPPRVELPEAVEDRRAQQRPSPGGDLDLFRIHGVSTPFRPAPGNARRSARG